MVVTLLRALAHALWRKLNALPPPPKVPPLPPLRRPVDMSAARAPLPSAPPPATRIAMAASSYDAALKGVLAHEGGYTDDADDPGGPTNWGITIGDYRAYVNPHATAADARSMPLEVAKRIYRDKYWNALCCDDLPAGVDYVTFDYGVNSGIGRAARALQQQLAVDVDGIIGPQTVAAAAQAADAKALINAICDERLAFLQNLATWRTFGRGWSTRVSEVRRDALAMAAGAAVEPPKPVPSPGSPELHDLGHRIKRTMLAKAYPWFDDQNVVSVEGMDPDGSLNANRPNAFDDIKMVLDGGGKIIGGPWEGTTHPGKYWTEHPMAEGGAFIIALGPQSCWTPGDYHSREVWRQAEDSTILGHRDPDCTYQRHGEPIVHGDIGVHHHGGYDLPKDNISNAAAGCQVIRLTDRQEEFMRITKRNPHYLKDPRGFRLTATVLEAKDVLP